MSGRRGIATNYNGVRMRSRVEARWADFFTRMGWNWTYEPFDLDGYIPDFSLEFYKPLLVEVKAADEDVAMAQSKIECSGWTGEALVVSGDWPAGYSGDSMPAIGWLAERPREHSQGPEFYWSHAILFECSNCLRCSLHHEVQSYHCRVNGCYDGDGFLGPCERVNPRDAWVKAGNRVQWRAA